MGGRFRVLRDRRNTLEATQCKRVVFSWQAQHFLIFRDVVAGAAFGSVPVVAAGGSVPAVAAGRTAVLAMERSLSAALRCTAATRIAMCWWT